MRIVLAGLVVAVAVTVALSWGTHRALEQAPTGPEQGAGRGVVVRGDDVVAFGIGSPGEHGRADMRVVVLSTAGEVRHRRDLGTPGDDWGGAVALGGGRLWVGGTRGALQAQDNRLWIATLDETGGVVAERSFDLGAGARLLDLDADADGAVWLARDAQGLVVQRVDAALEPRWRVRLTAPNASGLGVLAAPDRTWVVVTAQAPARGLRLVGIVDGDIDRDAQVSSERASTLAADRGSDGTLWLAAAHRRGVHLVRVEPDGRVRWERTVHPGPGADGTMRGVKRVRAVVADASGAWVLGHRGPIQTGVDWVVRVDDAGEVVWRRVHDVAGQGVNAAAALGDDLVVTGHHGTSRTGLAVWTARLGPDGAVVWQR